MIPVGEEKIKVGWVTSWNTKCGIASYSSFLIHNLVASYEVRILASHKDYLLDEDGPEVIRCWENNTVKNLDDLEKEIVEIEQLKVVVIQFQFAFFHLSTLGKLLERLHACGIKIIVFFHATKDVTRPEAKASLSEIKSSLAFVDRLLVHGIADLERLQRLGLSHNTEVFPQGVHELADSDVEVLRARLGFCGRPVVGTYGFLLPHKGIPELIEAFPLVLMDHPHATLLLVSARYPHAPARNLLRQCLTRIDALGIKDRVRLINDYLDDDESICLLGSMDLLVYPYQDTGESSSAAVRFGLASHRPVAITPVDIFQDVKDLCHFLPGITSTDIGVGINNLLKNPQILNSKMEIRRNWVSTHSWKTLASRLDSIIQSASCNNEIRPGKKLVA
jgi:glycosyltransferase involved in cell wall biosynthesis